MIELNDVRRELLGMCREMAPDLRARALSVDSAPEDMAAHLDSPTLTLLRTAAMPPRYRTGAPERVARYTDDCVAKVISNVELACGDAGVVANTGPGLAGVCVEALGSPEQQELFYDAIADGRTWALFAMTEPERGSDAGAMQTRFDPDPDGTDGYRLNGAKRYVGNGSRGSIGVVFGRTGKSPLTIRAAILRTPGSLGFTGRALDMVGLRGARISELDVRGRPGAARARARCPPARLAPRPLGCKPHLQRGAAADRRHRAGYRLRSPRLRARAAAVLGRHRTDRCSA